jgi:hypothetical protein
VKPTSVAIVLFLSVASARSEPLFAYGDREPAPAGALVVAAEAGAGLVGTIGFGLGFGALGVAIAGGPEDIQSPEVLKPAFGFIAGIAVGAPLGAGVGTWLAGSALQQEGRLSSTLLGAYAGLPVAAGIFYLSAVTKSDPLMVAAVLAPPAGAVIGYGLSRPCRCVFGSDSRLLPPVASVRSELLPDGTTALRTDIGLVRLGI